MPKEEAAPMTELKIGDKVTYTNPDGSVVATKKIIGLDRAFGEGVGYEPYEPRSPYFNERSE